MIYQEKVNSYISTLDWMWMDEIQYTERLEKCLLDPYFLYNDLKGTVAFKRASETINKIKRYFCCF